MRGGIGSLNVSTFPAHFPILIETVTIVMSSPIAPGRAHADHGSAGGGVSELPIDCGPGYRVYFVVVDRELAVLLAGGNKSTPAA